MKKLLILTGDLAAGKSTFADAVTRRFGVPSLEKDPVKEILSDVVGFSDRAENRRLSVAAVRFMEHAFSRLAQTGNDLILEANFRAEELDALAAIAAEHGYSVLTLVFRADDEVLYERFMARAGSGTRHPAHLAVSYDDREDFFAMLREMRAEAIPGETVLVDATDFSYMEDEALFERLDSFFSDRRD